MVSESTDEEESSSGEDWLASGGAGGGEIECDVVVPFGDEIEDGLEEIKLDSGRVGVGREDLEDSKRGKGERGVRLHSSGGRGGETRETTPHAVLSKKTGKVSPVTPPKKGGKVQATNAPWEIGIEGGSGKHVPDGLAQGDAEHPPSERKSQDKKEWKMVEFDSESEHDPLSHRSIYDGSTSGGSAHSDSGQGNYGTGSASSRSGEVRRSGSSNGSAGKSPAGDEEIVAKFRENSKSASASVSGSESHYVKSSRNTSRRASSDSSDDHALKYDNL